MGRLSVVEIAADVAAGRGRSIQACGWTAS
jgi:hypothetical protein